MERVFQPYLKKKYDDVRYIEYKKDSPTEVAGKIRSFQINSQLSYIFLHDLDEHSDPIVCQKKVCERYSNILTPEDVVVVNKEIESWYLAGVTRELSKSLKLKWVKNTETISKERFVSLMPNRFSSTTDFMVELLRHYSLSEAMTRNQSLRYFVDKFGILSE